MQLGYHPVAVITVQGLEKAAETETALYYIRNQQDATLAVLFISNCKIALHVSDAFCVHHQEY